MNATFNLANFFISLFGSIGCVWFAAKIVGAGESGFVRCALAGLLAVLLVIGGVMALGPLRGLLVAPLLMLLVFKFILDTSFVGALIIGVLTVAFQVGLNKLTGALAIA